MQCIICSNPTNSKKKLICESVDCKRKRNAEKMARSRKKQKKATPPTTPATPTTATSTTTTPAAPTEVTAESLLGSETVQLLMQFRGSGDNNSMKYFIDGMVQQEKVARAKVARRLQEYNAKKKNEEEMKPFQLEIEVKTDVELRVMKKTIKSRVYVRKHRGCCEQVQYKRCAIDNLQVRYIKRALHNRCDERFKKQQRHCFEAERKSVVDHCEVCTGVQYCAKHVHLFGGGMFSRCF
jgi:hypothetical protein